MNTVSYSEFESTAKAQGFDEVLKRVWAAAAVVDTHVHPFAVKALVVQGEFWLTCGQDTRYLRDGEAFELARDVPHAERYGSEGATVWVARCHGKDTALV